MTMKLPLPVLGGTAACGILAGFAIATLTTPSDDTAAHSTIAGEVNAAESAKSTTKTSSDLSGLDAENRALRA